MIYFILGFISCLIITTVVLVIVYFKINAKRKELLDQINSFKNFFTYNGGNQND